MSRPPVVESVMLNPRSSGATGGERIRRCAQPRNLTLLQPFRFLLTLGGLSPARSLLNALYQAWVFAWLVVSPILLLYMSQRTTSKFTESTLIGVGLLAIVPIFTQSAMISYLRSNAIEDELVFVESLDPNARRLVQIIVTLHSAATVAISAAISTFWIVNYYLAFRDYPLARDWTESKTRVLFGFQAVAVIHSVGAFVGAIAIYSTVCNLLRLQADLLASKISSDRTIEPVRVIRSWRELKASLRTTEEAFSRWLFPTLAIFVFSLTFQAVGYVSQRLRHQPKRFNGSYYLIPVGFVLIVLVGLAATVTAKVQRVRSSVVALFATNAGADGHLVALASCVESADVTFRIFGISVTPQLNNIIVFAIFCISGLFCWETLY